MNHTEIDASVAKAKNGDHYEMLKILEQYKPFIYKTAKQYTLKNYEFNDLVQISYITLINAVNKYKTGSNTFSPYAYNAVKNALRYTARQNIRHKDDLSLNSTINSSDNTKIEYIDCIESLYSFEEEMLKSEEIKEVKSALSKLPSDEMELISMVYYNRCSLKTFAEEKGLSYFQAARMKKRIFKKLNRQLLN